jgi:hypothetical protein
LYSTLPLTAGFFLALPDARGANVLAVFWVSFDSCLSRLLVVPPPPPPPLPSDQTRTCSSSVRE